MIYITGDKHGDYTDVLNFCNKYKTSKNDILIILGDAGINYYLDAKDYILKDSLKELPITLFCIHGNHEERPENIGSYKIEKMFDGKVFIENDYPNLIFLKDGEVYNFNNLKVLVIGGAFSIDKEYRIRYGYHWFKDEQPSNKTKEKVLNLFSKNNNIDIVLTHTCPYKYEPTEAFYDGIDQSKVDESTEYFLDKVEEALNYKKWYCGHFHINKNIDKICFLFDEIRGFDER